MHVSDFDFHLPDELIAQHAKVRGESRLFVLDRGSGTRRHTTIAELSSILVPGDVLVLNNTRVIAARLLGRRIPSGGMVECLLLGTTEPISSDAAVTDEPAPAYPSAQVSEVRVAQALVHPGQKLKPGSLMRFDGHAGVLVGQIIARHFHDHQRRREEGDRGT